MLVHNIVLSPSSKWHKPIQRRVLINAPPPQSKTLAILFPNTHGLLPVPLVRIDQDIAEAISFINVSLYRANHLSYVLLILVLVITEILLEHCDMHIYLAQYGNP